MKLLVRKNLLDVASNAEKAQCVTWFAETKSVTIARRNFRRLYHKAPPSENSMSWHKNFWTQEECDLPRSGRPKLSEESVHVVRESFLHNPQKSIRKASTETAIPPMSVHKILHKRLHYRAYHPPTVQALTNDDKPCRYDFACRPTMLNSIEDDPNYLKRIVFTNEATWHVSGRVDEHNVRVWGSENSHKFREIVQHSPKVNVWCGLMHDRVIGPFFLHENMWREIFTTCLWILQSYNWMNYNRTLFISKPALRPNRAGLFLCANCLTKLSQGDGLGVTDWYHDLLSLHWLLSLKPYNRQSL